MGMSGLDPARREELTERDAARLRASARPLTLPTEMVDLVQMIVSEHVTEARAEAFAAGDEYGYARGRTEVRARVEALADEWAGLDLNDLGTLSRPTTEALVHKMAADLRAAVADPTEEKS